MTEVKSPYNFVTAPTENEVYKPEWANQVSHDIPFSDGESGEITLKITAETPIFIRNGHSKEDHGIYEKWKKDENIKLTDNEKKCLERYLSFSNIDGRFFIPATSIKGMLRNVLEIMSFSRMRQVDERPFFGLRDMVNDTYSKQEIRNIITGWLVFKDNKWVIFGCKHDRVRLDSLARNAKTILRKVKDKQDIIPFEEATSIEKYKSLDIINFNKDYYFDSLVNIDKTGRVFSLSKSNTSNKGHLVLFGKMNNAGPTKKKYDYIFHAQEEIAYELESQSLVSNSLKLNQDEDTSLWHYFLNELKLAKIPIFFKLDGSKVKHFGFSKLYRLNNGHSIGDLEPVVSYKTLKKDDLDLAQLIFGTVAEKSDSFKGRVFISHAFCSDSPTAQINPEERVLSSPKPSYYPFYLKQEDNIPYNTYLNYNSVLAGFKRYPVHINPKPNGNHANENIPSNFIPLPAKTSFDCKIRFHNLRKVELGALLSSITFHNTSNLFHNLGAAKPYGFGKVKIDISNRPEYNQYMAQFENEMNEELKKIWIQTPQISELFSMAKTPESKTVNASLNYPQLELPNVQPKDANEFVNYKKVNPKLFLRPYSTLNGNVNSVSLLNGETLKIINKEKLEKIQEERRKEKEVKEAEEQRSKEIQALESHAKNALESNDFESAIDCYVKLDKMSIVDFDLNAKLQDVELKKTKHLSKIVEQRRLEEVLSNDNIVLITLFLKDYPLNNKKQELEMKLSSLKASSGIPNRLRTMTEWEKFKGEAPKWVKKVKESGEFVKFEAEFQDIVEKIVRVQFESDKTKRAWLKGTIESNHEWKKVTEWLGQEKAQELYKQLIP